MFTGPADAAAVAGLFGIFADLAYNSYSATNSSPQTTELFAGDRAATLWKYVRFGHGQAIAFGVAGTVLARRPWPLIGTATVGILMHCMYAHALYAGQKSAGQAGAMSKAHWGIG